MQKGDYRIMGWGDGNLANRMITNSAAILRVVVPHGAVVTAEKGSIVMLPNFMRTTPAPSEQDIYYYIIRVLDNIPWIISASDAAGAHHGQAQQIISSAKEYTVTISYVTEFVAYDNGTTTEMTSRLSVISGYNDYLSVNDGGYMTFGCFNTERNPLDGKVVAPTADFSGWQSMEVYGHIAANSSGYGSFNYGRFGIGSGGNLELSVDFSAANDTWKIIQDISSVAAPGKQFMGEYKGSDVKVFIKKIVLKKET